MRPYKRACRQTNFSEGKFRKESTPFSFISLIFFTLFLPLPFLSLFGFLMGSLGGGRSTLQYSEDDID